MADVTLGGKTRTLKFTVFALSELELRSGKHLGWFVTELAEGRCGPAVALWLLWAGLLHETPTVSRQEAERLVVGFLKDGGVTYDLLEPFVVALAESELYRARPAPVGNAQPDAVTPATSGSETGSTVTSQSSTGA